MLTIHEVLHLFADALNVTEHARGEIHAAIDHHAEETGAAIIAATPAAEDQAAEDVAAPLPAEGTTA